MKMEAEIEIKGEDNIEIKLQKYNVDELKDLINEWQGKRTDPFCDKLRKELLEQQAISLPTIIALSKRCHTGNSWANGELTAQKISELLFKKILPRLDYDMFRLPPQKSAEGEK